MVSLLSDDEDDDADDDDDEDLCFLQEIKQLHSGGNQGCDVSVQKNFVCLDDQRGAG